MAHVVITGAQGGETPGAVAPNRLEINNLIADHDQFSLYIQALNVMHNTPQNDPLSHFSISGIHGLPYERWQGAGDITPVTGAQSGGYCTHGTVLFPTWHRPYVALYEVTTLENVHITTPNGFDPIFYLHHANVDRLLSLWTAIHPEYGLQTAQPKKEPSLFRQITVSTRILVFTDILDLTPFWSRKRHSGHQLKLGLLKPSDTRCRSDCDHRRVTQLYGGPAPPPPAALPPPAAPPPPAALPPPAAPPPPAAAGGGPALAAQSQDHFYNWAVHIKFKKSELASSFAVLIFLGDVPDDHLKWRTSPSFIGAHVGLVNSVPYKCANCIEQAGTVVEGFVHLNRAIAKRSDISSYDPSVVAPYLKKNLHWRIQGADRKPIDFDKLPSLEVTVAEALLSLAPGPSLPTQGDPQYHHHITSGKAGGARSVQT
ncbi:hypothetical protein BJV74DRAFT_796153 [Russula compacta]|nr:hypothetical protein BJV74DRAFT_796153 [Russula compacta]